MRIGKIIYCPVEPDTPMNTRSIIKLLFTLYKIADHIAYQYLRFIEREICMRQVIHA